MGMHIRFYVERKTAEGWQLVSGGLGYPAELEFASLTRGRDMFAALAGKPEWSYGDVPPVAVDGAPKGLPLDASTTLLDDFAEDGGYAASWHMLATLLAYDWSSTSAEFNGLPEALRRMREVGRPDEVRAVFWFG